MSKRKNEGQAAAKKKQITEKQSTELCQLEATTFRNGSLLLNCCNSCFGIDHLIDCDPRSRGKYPDLVKQWAHEGIVEWLFDSSHFCLDTAHYPKLVDDINHLLEGSQGSRDQLKVFRIVHVQQLLHRLGIKMGSLEKSLRNWSIFKKRGVSMENVFYCFCARFEDSEIGLTFCDKQKESKSANQEEEVQSLWSSSVAGLASEFAWAGLRVFHCLNGSSEDCTVSIGDKSPTKSYEYPPCRKYKAGLVKQQPQPQHQQHQHQPPPQQQPQQHQQQPQHQQHHHQPPQQQQPQQQQQQEQTTIATTITAHTTRLVPTTPLLARQQQQQQQQHQHQEPQHHSQQPQRQQQHQPQPQQPQQRPQQQQQPQHPHPQPQPQQQQQQQQQQHPHHHHHQEQQPASRAWPSPASHSADVHKNAQGPAPILVADAAALSFPSSDRVGSLSMSSDNICRSISEELNTDADTQSRTYSWSAYISSLFSRSSSSSSNNSASNLAPAQQAPATHQARNNNKNNNNSAIASVGQTSPDTASAHPVSGPATGSAHPAATGPRALASSAYPPSVTAGQPAAAVRVTGAPFAFPLFQPGTPVCPAPAPSAFPASQPPVSFSRPASSVVPASSAYPLPHAPASSAFPPSHTPVSSAFPSSHTPAPSDVPPSATSVHRTPAPSDVPSATSVHRTPAPSGVPSATSVDSTPASSAYPPSHPPASSAYPSGKTAPAVHKPTRIPSRFAAIYKLTSGSSAVAAVSSGHTSGSSAFAAASSGHTSGSSAFAAASSGHASSAFPAATSVRTSEITVSTAAMAPSHSTTTAVALTAAPAIVHAPASDLSSFSRQNSANDLPGGHPSLSAEDIGFSLSNGVDARSGGDLFEQANKDTRAVSDVDGNLLLIRSSSNTAWSSRMDSLQSYL